MKKKDYKCLQCGNDFEVEKVMSQAEARDRQLRIVPIRCPRCQSTNVKER
jgi:DNA-directed RNA polymerase subunit RPC12/RpoP